MTGGRLRLPPIQYDFTVDLSCCGWSLRYRLPTVSFGNRKTLDRRGIRAIKSIHGHRGWFAPNTCELPEHARRDSSMVNSRKMLSPVAIMVVITLAVIGLCTGAIASENGLLGTYRNMDCNHPDAGTDITGVVGGLVETTLPLRLTPKATHSYPWGQYIYQFDWFRLPVSFQRVDPSIDWSYSWFPLDEGLCGDPYHFSVHWEALIWASEGGDYDFHIGSDDDSWLFIDGILRFDLGGIHGYEMRSGSVHLTKGPHALDLFFAERKEVQSGIKLVFPLALLVPRRSWVTGGGWIPGDTPGPRYRRTFGFNAHYEPGLTRGCFQFKDPALRMKVHSNTVVAMAYDSNTVRFSGGCTINGEDGYFFICTVGDNGEPGRGVDWFAVDITDFDEFSYHAEGLLGGGNIQIHESEYGRQPVCLGSPRPTEPVLLQNLPNPFRSKTTIYFALPETRHVTLAVYDVTGSPVDILINQELPAGAHAIDWNPEAPAGTYFCRLTAGTFADVKRTVVLR